ncbi:ABC transporter family protein, partial [Vibrio parahaemolyticus V-223/04]
ESTLRSKRVSILSSFPAVSSSASRLPVPYVWNRTYSFLTNRLRRLTRK